MKTKIIGHRSSGKSQIILNSVFVDLLKGNHVLIICDSLETKVAFKDEINKLFRKIDNKYKKDVARNFKIIINNQTEIFKIDDTYDSIYVDTFYDINEDFLSKLYQLSNIIYESHLCSEHMNDLIEIDKKAFENQNFKEKLKEIISYIKLKWF